jgi:hypothetical protein
MKLIQNICMKVLNCDSSIEFVAQRKRPCIVAVVITHQSKQDNIYIQ